MTKVDNRSLWERFLNVLADIRIYPLGVVLYGQTEFNITGEHIRAILDEIQPGDVLLTRFNNYIGSFFIPKYWAHAGIYVGDTLDGPQQVLHVMGPGSRSEDILTFLRNDNVLLLRAKDPDLAVRARNKAITMHPVDYDFGFQEGDDENYCSEFVWEAFDKHPEIKQTVSWILPGDLICPLFDIILRFPEGRPI